MKPSALGYSILACAALSSAGCSIDVAEPFDEDASGPADEAIGSTTEAFDVLAPPPGWGHEFSWKQGDRPTDLGIGVCVLSGVSGRFDGLGEKVQITERVLNFSFGSEKRTVLTGSSAQDGVSARAICFDTRLFTSTRGPDRLIGPAFTHESIPWYGCLASQMNTMRGSNVAYITGMGGEFRGGAEYVQMGQNFTVDTFNEMYFGGCQDGGTFAESRGFFVGNRFAPTIPRMVMPPGWNQQNAEWVVRNGNFGNGGRPSTLQLAPAETSMCYLTRVSGDFRGGGERVTLTRDTSTGNWRLSVQKGSASSGITASARCMQRDQG